MDVETYRLIGRAYSEIEKKQPWLDGVSSVADIGLLSYDGWLATKSLVNPAGDGNRKLSDVGALRILLEGHYLFDVLDCQSELSSYKLIILPDGITVDERLKTKLESFVAHGGKLLASGRAGLYETANGGTGDFAFDFGVSYCGKQPIAPSYLSVKDGLEGVNGAGYVLYADSQRVELSVGGICMAEMHLPYFERTAKHFCSHAHAPERCEYAGVGVAMGQDGIYIANSIFREYAEVGSLIAKKTVCAAIDKLLGDRKTVRTQLPATGIVTLMDQREEDRYVLHLLYAPRTVKGSKKIEVIEDCVPLYNTEVKMNVGNRQVSRVYLAPQQTELEYSLDSRGELTVNVPKIEIHAMVVVEWQRKEKQ